MNFSATQCKILLATWSLVLLALYFALWLMGSSHAALVLSFFAIVPMQATCIIYFVASAALFAIWFFGRQKDYRDYILILLISAIIFAYLLRNTPINYGQAFLFP